MPVHGSTREADQVHASLKTIGFIGAGNIGGALAGLAVDARYGVVISNSRAPDTLSDLVGKLGPNARAATAADAASAGDLVVVTVPLKAYREMPVKPLAGKVVIDTNNYYPDRDGRIAELDDERTTSSALLQTHLGTESVVKAFNTVYFGHLGALRRPHGAADRSALAIAGDDQGDKDTVTAFADAVGFDTYDAGSLSEGWRFENDATPYPYSTDGSFEHPGPADTDRIASLLAHATHRRDR